MGRHTGEPLAAAERRQLCDLFEQVGPDAPTLSGSWTTYDLAAHLVTRESRLDAGPGLVLPPLRAYTARLESATKARTSYADLVAALRAGPPLRSLQGLPVLKERLNVHEFFIHHEDVRRAQPGWSPRDLPASAEAELWRVLVTSAPLLVRRVRGTRLRLRTPDGREHAIPTIRPGSDEVTLSGRVGELFLYLWGRRSAAEVEVTGSVAAQARLAAVPLGM